MRVFVFVSFGFFNLSFEPKTQFLTLPLIFNILRTNSYSGWTTIGVYLHRANAHILQMSPTQNEYGLYPSTVQSMLFLTLPPFHVPNPGGLVDLQVLKFRLVGSQRLFLENGAHKVSD